MKRRLQFATFLALVIVAWLLWRNRGAELNPGVERDGSGPPQSRIENPKSKIPHVDATELATDLNAPAGDVRADLRIVGDILATYRTNFLREGNPAGNNAEITAALRGRNPLRLVFIPDGHPALNSTGELCDRWGTPYFFHAASGTEMEIRSAGPDRKLHTADDLVLAP